jgi:single-stranded-DNA-specific exonuclease
MAQSAVKKPGRGTSSAARSHARSSGALAFTPFGVAHKQIRLREQNEAEAKKIEKTHGVSPVTARILAARGFTSDERLKTYLEPTLKEGLPPPHKLLNLEAAAQLVAGVARAGKSIAICCDFDVDGLSGGAQVCHFLKSAGIPVRVFVPDRFQDGYGLNENMVREIAASGFSLMITVDYGTTNTKELGLARELGLSTIVIDHHHVGDHRPPCDLFVNPQQSNCGFAEGVLCAAGLAWYFVAALRTALAKDFPAVGNLDPRRYLDLACLGTICDMVPLKGPNRVIAKRGLEMLSSTTRAGLIALKSVIGAKKDVSCYDVSFGIGPRLNAAGRMVHGEMVIDLLTTADKAFADELAGKLNRLNAERQETELAVKEKAISIIESRYHASGLPAGLVVWDDTFHTGVIGIVAQRLVENFYRPSVVMGLDEKGVYKGSVRGIKGFSVVEALGAVGEHLLKFGGHEGAGGFSVEASKLEGFAEAFVEECGRRLEGIETSPFAEADTEVALGEISLDLVNELKRLAPFGMGNPNPQLLVKGLKVMDLRTLKGTHLKATLSDGSRFMAGMLWRQTTHPALEKGALVNVAIRADYNTFNGVTELQGNLQAIELVKN